MHAQYGRLLPGFIPETPTPSDAVAVNNVGPLQGFRRRLMFSAGPCVGFNLVLARCDTEFLPRYDKLAPGLVNSRK